MGNSALTTRRSSAPSSMAAVSSAPMGSCTVSDADDVTLLLVGATSYNNAKDISGDATARCEEYLRSIGEKSYEDLVLRTSPTTSICSIACSWTWGQPMRSRSRPISGCRRSRTEHMIRSLRRSISSLGAIC